MSSSALLAEGPLDPPVLLADIKTEPPEELLASDCGQPQAEPVDLSLNKSKVAAAASAPPPPAPASVQSSPLLVAPPLPAPTTVSISPSGLSSTSAIPAVLSPGSILASTQGSGGQQILHVIHTIPSVNLPSKMGNLQTIPVVVQSLPVVYTTMPTDGVTAITVPLIGGDGKNAGSGKGTWWGSTEILGGGSCSSTPEGCPVLPPVGAPPPTIYLPPSPTAPQEDTGGAGDTLAVARPAAGSLPALPAARGSGCSSAAPPPRLLPRTFPPYPEWGNLDLPSSVQAAQRGVPPELCLTPPYLCAPWRRDFLHLPNLIFWGREQHLGRRGSSCPSGVGVGFWGGGVCSLLTSLTPSLLVSQ